MLPLTLDELASLEERLDEDPDGASIPRETIQRLALLLAATSGPPLPRNLARVLVDIVAADLAREEA